LSVAKQMRTGKEKVFLLPVSCPACGSKLHTAAEEVALRCENAGCPAQIKERMLHFASRDAMDIEGMGIAITDQLVDKGLIKDYADIYYLKMDNIKKLDRFAEKSATNLLSAIEKSKSRDLNRLIYALGIRHVGERLAWVLADHFGSISGLSAAGIDELTRIDEVGPVMAESISDFFSNKENLKILKRLSETGINMSQSVEKVSGGALEGKTVVITGTLKNYSRSRAEELVRKLGGNPSSSVSKNTYLVVAGDEPGSKIDKFRRIAG
jgi:DNA ligase (NAD+)